MNIAIFTCADLPEPDRDQGLLQKALLDEGLRSVLVAWDRPLPSDSFALGVVRSTWNYIHHLAAFRQWVTSMAQTMPLYNSAEVVLANLEKSYLLRLHERGVRVVPTTILGPNSEIPSETLLFAEADRIVIKPEVSAGSFATRTFLRDEAEAAQAFLRECVAMRPTMIQPYMAAVDSVGEHAIVVIDGEVSHAVRKSPRFADGDESVSSALNPTAAQRALALSALGPTLDRLLYGRVDMVQEEGGEWVVMELELTEPSLFLREHPPALKRFAQGIARRAVAQSR